MKLVVTKKDVVHLDSCKIDNIYAFVYASKIYKLQWLDNGCAFVPLHNSHKENYYFDDKIKKSIERASKDTDVYEFKDIKEFLEWCLEYESK